MSNEPRKRYRYVDPWTTGNTPVLEEYYEVRKTPSGAWVVPSYTRMVRPLEERSLRELKDDWGARFVLDGDGRRYAHETEELARYSYRRRKLSQIKHAKASLANAERMLHWLDTGGLPQSEVFCFGDLI